MACTGYKYTPLQHRDSIRLLILESSAWPDDPLSITLEEYPLDGSREFMALSYT